MKRTIKAVRRLLLPALLALMTGCASLPDVTPYRDATLKLRSTVLAGGHAVQAGLETAAAEYPAQDPTTKDLREKAARFSTAWQARIEGADALVAYTEAVANIARAGAEGPATARSLADALIRLATGVGIALPPAGTVAPVTDVAAFVYGHIAAARASQSLDQALQAAQPAVDRVASVLSRDLRDSVEILRAAHDLQLTAVTDQYRSERGYLTALNRERKALYAKDALTPGDEQRLRQIGELFEATRAWREPMEKSLAMADANLKTRVQRIQATQTAVAEWAAAHRGIAAAVREKRTVNVEALVQATLEAQELVRRLRAL